MTDDDIDGEEFSADDAAREEARGKFFVEAAEELLTSFGDDRAAIVSAIEAALRIAQRSELEAFFSRVLLYGLVPVLPPDEGRELLDDLGLELGIGAEPH